MRDADLLSAACQTHAVPGLAFVARRSGNEDSRTWHSTAPRPTYEVSFSQRNPHGFSCDLYGPLCDHHQAVGDSPAKALASAIPPALATDSGPIPWTR